MIKKNMSLKPKIKNLNKKKVISKKKKNKYNIKIRNYWRSTNNMLTY